MIGTHGKVPLWMAKVYGGLAWRKDRLPRGLFRGLFGMASDPTSAKCVEVTNRRGLSRDAMLVVGIADM